MATRAPDSASFSAIPRPMPREPPVTSACLPLSDMVSSSLGSAIAAMMRPMSSAVWMSSLRPVLTCSTVPRMRPALDRATRTMKVLSALAVSITRPFSRVERLPPITANVKSSVSAGSDRVWARRRHAAAATDPARGFPGPQPGRRGLERAQSQGAGDARLPGPPTRPGPPARQARRAPVGRDPRGVGPGQLASGAVRRPQGAPGCGRRRTGPESGHAAARAGACGRRRRRVRAGRGDWNARVPGPGRLPLPGRSAGRARARRGALRRVARERTGAAARAGPGGSRPPPGAPAQERKSGSPEAAIRTALQLLTLDPLQEAVHRVLMGLYVDAGRREAALRQYQHCVRVLQRELGVEPGAATKVLYQEILRQRPRRSVTPTAPAARVSAPAVERPSAGVESELVGRSQEIERLCAELAGAATGTGRVVVVLGEGGIGKSRLVGELADRALRGGTAVVIGRSYESEQILPFGPWVDALRAGRVADDAELLGRLTPAVRAELARLVPDVLGGAAPAAATTDMPLISRP